jgi:hypothetical protein
MATLTTQTITRAGITPSYASAAASDAFETGDICFLHAKNTNGSTRDLVFAIPSGKSTYANVTYTSVTVTLPATTGDKMIGPLGDLFRDPTTSLGLVTPSVTTGVTYGIFKLQGP